MQTPFAMPEKRPNALLHGALDALILKTLTRGPSHGYAIARFIEETSGETVLVEDGSLFRPFTGWNGEAGSKPNGACQSSAAAPNSTA